MLLDVQVQLRAAASVPRMQIWELLGRPDFAAAAARLSWRESDGIQIADVMAENPLFDFVAANWSKDGGGTVVRRVELVDVPVVFDGFKAMGIKLGEGM